MAIYTIFFTLSAAYVAAVITPSVLIVFVFNETGGDFMYRLGKHAALAGTMILSLQVLLAARIKWITRTFGFDIVIRYHKYIVLFGTLLLAAHPVLLAVGPYGMSLLSDLPGPPLIFLGKLSFLLLLVMIAVSLLWKTLRLSFERWRVIHNIIYILVIGIALVHGILIGSDMQKLPLRIIWFALGGGNLVLFAYHRFIRPALLKKHAYRVEEVRKETDNVWTLRLTPTDGRKRFDFAPGQFQFITLYRGRGLPVEEHHFTIASSPEETLQTETTIKVLGDFTSTICKTAPGDLAAVHAPFGRFSYVVHPDETRLYMFAGGIGITPCMSMIRTLHARKLTLPVTLWYGNNRREEILFADELEKISASGHPRLEVVHVLRFPPDGWNGETGFVDREVIRRNAAQLDAATGCYVVGPKPFLKLVSRSLREMGVKNRRLHTEIFSLID